MRKLHALALDFLCVIVVLSSLVACSGGGGQGGAISINSENMHQCDLIATEAFDHTGDDAYLSVKRLDRETALASAQFTGGEYRLAFVDGRYQPVESTVKKLSVEAADTSDGLDLLIQTDSGLDASALTFVLGVDGEKLALLGVEPGDAAGGTELCCVAGFEYASGGYEYTIAVRGGLSIEPGTVATLHLTRDLKAVSQNPRHPINMPEIQPMMRESGGDGWMEWEEYNIGDADSDGWVTTADLEILALFDGQMSGDNSPSVSPSWRRFANDGHMYLDYSTQLNPLEPAEYLADYIVNIGSGAAPDNDAKIYSNELIDDAGVTSYAIEVMEVDESRSLPWGNRWYPLVDALYWDSYGTASHVYNDLIDPEFQEMHPLNPLSKLHVQRNKREANVTVGQYNLESGETDYVRLRYSVFRYCTVFSDYMPLMFRADISEIQFLFGERTHGINPATARQRAYRFRVRPMAENTVQTGEYQGTYSSGSEIYMFDALSPEFLGIKNKSTPPVGIGAAEIRWDPVTDVFGQSNPVSYRIYYLQGDHSNDAATFFSTADYEKAINPLTDGTDLLYYITDLDFNEVYSFAVTAIDDRGLESDNKTEDYITVFYPAEFDETGPIIRQSKSFSVKPSPDPYTRAVVTVGHPQSIRYFFDADTLDNTALTNLSFKVYINGAYWTTGATDADPATYGFQINVDGLAGDTTYECELVAVDTSNNETLIDQVEEFTTWQDPALDTRPPAFVVDPNIYEVTQTEAAGELDVTFFPALDQHPITYLVYVSDIAPDPGNPEAWFQSVIPEQVDEATLALSDEEFYTYRIAGLAGGTVHYIGLRAVDSLSNASDETNYSECVAGIFNRYSIAPSQSSLFNSAGSSMELTTGKWYAMDSTGSYLGLVMSYYGRLHYGLYDTLTHALTLEPITDQYGPVFCNGRAAIAFNEMNVPGILYVRSDRVMDNAPGVSGAHTTSSSAPGDVYYMERPLPLMSSTIQEWDRAPRILEGPASNLHLEFVAASAAGARTIPLAVFAMNNDATGYSSEGQIWRRDGNSFSRKYCSMGSKAVIWRDSAVQSTGEVQLLSSLESWVIEGDATGLTWPDPGLAWPIDPYTTRTVALGVPGLSSYGPRGFDQYNGNEILHLNSLDVSTLANGGSWIYQWVSQDYMQVMDVTQAGAVLAGAVLRGASADDVGLCYLSELGDSPHDRSIWFCDTAAGYLRYTYELPGWSGVYLEHPVALCRYSGNTIPASDKMLVVYQGESGIEFLQEQ